MLTGNRNSVRNTVLVVLMASVLGLAGVVAMLVAEHVRLPTFLLPPMAMPAPVPDGYVKPYPVGNPGEWFSNDDYPDEARRRGEEGLVVITIGIDTEGRPRVCEVTQSSGHASLDKVTCDLVMQRGRYAPARTPAGTPIDARVTIPGVRWQLEE